MKFSINISLIVAFALCTQASFGQSINSETIEVQLLQTPRIPTEASSRTYKVVVNSPYNLTAEGVIQQAKAEHQKAVDNYANTVKQSQDEYQQKLKDYDAEVKKAKEKYELESAEFKKLSLLERLAMTDQGKNPKLVIPAKPEYYKPAPPVYKEPDLNDYNIVDNAVLASQISLEGFRKEGNHLDVSIDLQPTHFQDNAGQTYANQPTKLVVKVNGAEKVNQSFFNDFEFISSSPTNNINKPLEEKKFLKKVMTALNQYLNEQFGYKSVSKKIEIECVKNKGSYDDLEKANIYITTNLKKLQANSDTTVNTVAFINMQKGIDIWLQTLQKIDYKNSKADLNEKIGRYILFNLMRLNLALGRKKEAEKYLNQLQENLVDIKLSKDDKKEMDQLEKEIYKTN